MYTPSKTNYAKGDSFPATEMNSLLIAAQNTFPNLGRAPLDSFSGSSDDDRLTAAMSYAGAQTYPPIITLGNQSYTFVGTRTPYDGFRLEGCGRLSNSEQSDVNMFTKIDVTAGPGGFWLDAEARVENCYVGGLAALGHSSTAFIGGSGLWASLCMRDVSFHSFQSVCGSQATSMKLSCCLFDGWWQVQGCYNGAIHVGGSDSRLWVDYGCLIDATPGYNTSGNAAGQFHFWFDYMDNTTVGPLYITAEGPWGGVRVDGPGYNSQNAPSNRGSIVIYGSAIEGRNASQPCYGAVVRVNGGTLKLRDAYIGRAMSNPSAMGHSPQDAGYIHVTGGSVLIDGMTVDKYTGQSESVPVVYNNGGHVRVSNVDVATKGGIWSGLPLVTNVSGDMHSDDTVRTS